MTECPLVHRLEIYPCTHDVWCLGCFRADAAEETDAPAPATDRAPVHVDPAPHLPGPGAAPTPAFVEPPIDHSAARALAEAHWRGGPRRIEVCLPEEKLEAHVRILEFPSGACVSFAITDEAATYEHEVAATSDAGAASASWSPPRPGRYRFTASCGEKSAHSPWLDVLSWTRITLVDGAGRPVPDAAWRLTDADGAQRAGTTGTAGAIGWKACAAGSLTLEVLALALAPADDALEPPSPAARPARAIAVGAALQVEGAIEHVVQVDRGLVLCVRQPASTLDSVFGGADVVVADSAGAELGRCTLARARVPQGDHVTLAFPEIRSDQAVEAFLEWSDGARAPLFALQSPLSVDGRHAPRPTGGVAEGAAPEHAEEGAS